MLYFCMAGALGVITVYLKNYAATAVLDAMLGVRPSTAVSAPLVTGTARRCVGAWARTNTASGERAQINAPAPTDAGPPEPHTGLVPAR